jgi:luciferase family oxidoreductase group 1
VDGVAVALSVIDFGLPSLTLRLAPRADALGYTRYWLGEHHSANQSASPLILTALVAGLTERIRVGPAGVLLPLYSPLKVAEDARLLEETFSGRIDLGVVKGMRLTPTVGDALLDAGRAAREPATFAARVRLLHGLLAGTLPPDHPWSEIGFGCSTECPALWVLGVGPGSAELAGELGVSFCFSQHHNLINRGGIGDARACLDAHRRCLDHTAPRLPAGDRHRALAIGGICGEREAEARAAHAEYAGVLPISFLGDAEQCANQIGELAHRANVTEVVVLDHWPFMDRSPERQLEDRTRTLELLAGALL